MEGLAASGVLIAILLALLLVAGGLVYLLARRLPKRSPEPPGKPVNRRIGLRWVILVLLVIDDYGRGSSQPQTPSRSLAYS